MKFEWSDQHAKDGLRYLKRYFGDWQGLTSVFACMRNEYPWDSSRPSIPDSRVAAKNNTEYHGLERHAAQYRAAAMYDEARHHWLMAVMVRKADMDAHGFDDDRHRNALSFCLRNAAFDEALGRWSKEGSVRPVPQPEEFGLREYDIARNELKAQAALDKAYEEISLTDETSES